MQANMFYNCLPNIILWNAVRYYARRGRGINPGVQKRMNVLNDKQDSTEEIDFEDLETDFMDAGKMHKIHEKQLKDYQEKEKFWIVRRKYFKEKQINFLTWNDKEQIRYLHNTNPNEWTVEKLSEGFPALPQVINKILKVKWQPKSKNKIKTHDARVENNWKLFKQGNLQLQTEVAQHLSKFTDRKPKIDVIEQKIIIEQPIVKPQGEYGSIIENYNKLTKKTSEENKVETRLEMPKIEKESIPVDKSKRKKHLTTLIELRKEIAREIDLGKKVDEYDKMILKESNASVQNISDVKNNNLSTDLKNSSLTADFKNSGLTTYKVESNVAVNEDKKVFDSLRYPEKITIPKEVYKKGFTYKVNDCFYDYDGEFLYRVPGM